MATTETIAKHLQELLLQQQSLLVELKSLAPAECADPDTTNIRVKPWQRTLLAIDDALCTLDDLAGDYEIWAQLDTPGQMRSSAEGNRSTVNTEDHDHAR